MDVRQILDRLAHEMENNYDGSCYTITTDTMDLVKEALDGAGWSTDFSRVPKTSEDGPFVSLAFPSKQVIHYAYKATDGTWRAGNNCPVEWTRSRVAPVAWLEIPEPTVKD